MFKFWNLTDKSEIANKFMNEHKIIYKYDTDNKKGFFERLATHAVACVRTKFGENYLLKDYNKETKGDETKSDKKRRRRNLVKIPFDPNVNLKRLEMKSEKKETKEGHSKKLVSEKEEDNSEDNVMQKILGKFEEYFKNTAAPSILNIEDVKRVR